MIAIEDTMILDIETDEDQLVAVGISGAFEDDEVLVFHGDFVPTWVWEALEGNVWIVEHTLYDARFLRSNQGCEVTNVVDTRALAHAENENGPFDLESVAYRYCGIVMDKRIKREPDGSQKKRPMFTCDDGTKVRIKDAPWDQLSKYLKGDVDATRMVYRHLRKALGQNEVERVTRLTNVLSRMEARGLPVDEEGAEALRSKYEAQLQEMESRLREDAGLPESFNFNSPDQLAGHLYLEGFELAGKLPVGETAVGFTTTSMKKKWRYGTWAIPGRGLKIPKWTGGEPGKGQPATDAKTLAVHFGSDPWISLYLQSAKLRTALSWLRSLPEHVRDGRVYGTFNQAGTVTGRLSSASPNLQNVSRRGEIGGEIRSLFSGDLVVADFSQLEPRIAAHLSQDPVLLDVYRQGKDIYKVLGSHVFQVREEDVTPEQREVDKLLILSMFYGAQARKTAENLSVAGFHTTQKVAGQYLSHVQELFSGFFEWRERLIKRAYQSGYVETIGGRLRHLNFRGADAWRVERQTVNSAIQGSAADIVNGTMEVVDATIPELAMLAQVHDELVLEILEDWNLDEVLGELQRAGERSHGFELDVPLVFEPKVVKTWQEK